MKKYQILEKFNEITGKWDNWGDWTIEQFSKWLKKDECSYLLSLAESGYREFRLFNDFGYALTDDYKRIMIYDHRKASA